MHYEGQLIVVRQNAIGKRREANGGLYMSICCPKVVEYHCIEVL